ncbi:hypothetical protein [Alkalibacterium putridalgicola]|nr:hypothetical protein [Alkalibacterium putridalgicola]
MYYWNDSLFYEVMNKEILHLPMEHGDKDYYYSLRILLTKYYTEVKYLLNKKERKKLLKIIKLLLDIILMYDFNDFAKMDSCFERVVEILPKIGDDKILKNFYSTHGDDPLKLYRSVPYYKGNTPAHKYGRKGIFHIRFSEKGKASSSRYSIEGEPCLYLGTNLATCINEAGLEEGLISRFRFDRLNSSNIVYVYDLAIKPQDFFDESKIEEIKDWTGRDISEKDEKKRYVFWYPLIAACSFIRNQKDKNEGIYPYEYLIPQLFMRFLKNKKKKESYNTTINYGVRYFSCKSVEDSNVGYNYAFPTSEVESGNSDFCIYLADIFLLTEPFPFLKNDIKENHNPTINIKDKHMKKISGNQ